MSIHKVTRGSCCRHLHLKAAASVMKNASPRRYSNHVGTAWGEPSGAVTATTATFGSVRNCAISRFVIGMFFTTCIGLGSKLATALALVTHLFYRPSNFGARFSRNALTASL